MSDVLVIFTNLETLSNLFISCKQFCWMYKLLKLKLMHITNINLILQKDTCQKSVLYICYLSFWPSSSFSRSSSITWEYRLVRYILIQEKKWPRTSLLGIKMTIAWSITQSKTRPTPTYTTLIKEGEVRIFLLQMYD